MAYLWWAFGDPLLFGAVQAYWGRELTLPTTAIWRGAVTAVSGVRWLAAHGVGPILGTRLPSGGLDSDVIANLLEFCGFAAAVAMLVAGWRKLPAAYTLYALVALLFPLLYSTTARPLYSLPRFIIIVFPLFIGAAGCTAAAPSSSRGAGTAGRPGRTACRPPAACASRRRASPPPRQSRRTRAGWRSRRCPGRRTAGACPGLGRRRARPASAPRSPRSRRLARWRSWGA